ncbi:MAG: hypothetical protein IJT32_06940 [Lachnospiraceae bacterium]|nr:hypothetical protein [Lachnospiraceae bacterium]
MVILVIKIIGIVLLVIIGLLLIALGYLIFAPFGYHFGMQVQENVTVDASGYDALRFACFKICSTSGVRTRTVSLFWGLLKKVKVSGGSDDDEAKNAEEKRLIGESTEDNSTEEGEPAKGASKEAEAAGADKADKAEKVKAEELSLPQKATDSSSEAATADKKATAEDAGDDAADKADGPSDDRAEKPDDPSGDADVSEGQEAFEEAVTEEVSEEASRQPDDERDLFDKLSDRIEGSMRRIEKSANKLAALEKELSDPRNRAAIRFVFERSILLLSQIKPQIYEADMTYGFDEPHLTGELTGVLALCPVMYEKKVRMVPDFTSDRIYITGYAKARGQVRLYVFLVFAMKLFFSADCRRLYKRFRRGIA